jgi:hypothetical protein
MPWTALALLVLAASQFLNRQRGPLPRQQPNNDDHKSWVERYGAALAVGSALLVALITVSGNIYTAQQANETAMRNKQLEVDHQQVITSLQLQAENTRHRITTQKDIDIKQLEVAFADKQSKYSRIMNKSLELCRISTGNFNNINDDAGTRTEKIIPIIEEVRVDIVSLYSYMSIEDRQYIIHIVDAYFGTCAVLARTSQPGERYPSNSELYIASGLNYADMRDRLATILFPPISFADK